MPNTSAELRNAKYINLRSFKKDGQPVDTPVWFANVGADKLVVFTVGTSYKVKRIRRNPNVEIARCGARGKLKGPWSPAICRALDHTQEQDRVAKAYNALNAKYGLLMRIGTLFATLSGRTKNRLILEITLPSA
jgi:PPOX class probable F420-dependent enzyme